MVSEEHVPMCQHVTMSGEGIPCSSRGIHFCFHCHSRVCGQHVRWRRWTGVLFDTAYCVGCDEAAREGRLKLHD